jgi:hypothetical protein
MNDIVNTVTPQVLFNESFAATNQRERSAQLAFPPRNGSKIE